MKLRPILLVIFSFCVLFLSTCDSKDPVEVANEVLVSNTIELAPENPDPKVIAVAETHDFHLANCPRTVGHEWTVIHKSEALALGYTPCDLCLPPPPEPIVPHVLVIDGSMEYHRAGCIHLNDTQKAIPLTTVIDQGYLPCAWCYPELQVPGMQPLNVWVTPGTGKYHRSGCPELTDDKVLMLKSDAIASGYVPCECNTDVYIPGAIVYYCPDYGEKYHGIGCPYLDQCNSVVPIFIWDVQHIGNGLEPCDRCKGKPWPPKDDED